MAHVRQQWLFGTEAPVSATVLYTIGFMRLMRLSDLVQFLRGMLVHGDASVGFK
jgi:hypothetical protein